MRFAPTARTFLGDQRDAKRGGLLAQTQHNSTEWMVRVTHCSEDTGWKLGACDCLAQTEPTSLPNHWRNGANPYLPAGAGKRCKTSWAGLTTASGFFIFPCRPLTSKTV